jgi:hypothetical protein
MTLFEEDRLKSSINCRQNLLNYFEVFLNDSYQPRSAAVILEDKKSVENYFALTSLRLIGIRNHFITAGTKWQKERLCVGLRK